jgi:sulfur carrier protein
MSTVLVNGKESQVPSGSTVADLVAGWCVSAKGVAVARNGDAVPKSRWHATPLEPGDRLEIVTAAAGG